MGDFKRRFEKIDKLKSDRLFTEKILGDVDKGDVFATIRDNEIHFYYKGGRIFTYKDEFVAGKDFLENVLDFTNDYEKIKENCKGYSYKKDDTKRERSELSWFYNKSNMPKDFILIDIEVGLPQIGSRNSKVEESNTQIDLCLLNLVTGRLIFIEAKEARDPRISQKQDDTIEVDLQMKKYERMLKYHKDSIESSYMGQLEFLQNIGVYTGIIPDKLEAEIEPRLLIYGYNPSIFRTNDRRYQPKKKGIEFLRKYYDDRLILIEQISKFPFDRL